MGDVPRPHPYRDAPGLRETFNWLVELQAQGRTILLVTHDMALTAEYADRLIVLHEGQIIGDGAPADIFEEADLLARASLTPPPLVTVQV